MDNHFIIRKDVLSPPKTLENRRRVWQYQHHLKVYHHSLLKVKIFLETLNGYSCPRGQQKGSPLQFPCPASFGSFLETEPRSFGIRTVSSLSCWRSNCISRLQCCALARIHLPATKNLSIIFLFQECPGCLFLRMQLLILTREYFLSSSLWF